MNKFYVYLYLRSHDSQHGEAGTPYYIGKGFGYRAVDRWNHTIPTPADRQYITYVAKGMTEKDALQLEMLLIHLHGRISNGTGCLRNLSDGGEAPYGHRMSEEAKWKASELRKGTPLSAEHKSRISAGLRASGRRLTPEHKAKLIEASRYKSPETRQKLREALKGRPLTLEHIANRTAAQRGLPKSAECRKKIGDAHRGMKHTPEARALMSSKALLRYAKGRVNEQAA